MVREFWPTIQIEERLNVMDSMVKKLQNLKKIVKVWMKRKEEEDIRDIIQIEGNIKKTFVRNLTTNFSEEDKAQLKNILELKKDDILRRSEEL